MKRIVWCCWLQGRANASWLVTECLSSWERHNPSWDVRCLDQEGVARLVDLPELSSLEISPAAIADVARILLLNKYGGVWTDATVYCNRPLDEWLGPQLTSGFFAFSRPTHDRMLSSWFLASEANHLIVDRWCARTLEYWVTHKSAHDYFWFHHLFGELFNSDPVFAAAWKRVPSWSAAEPHAIQTVGMFRTDEREIRQGVNWQCPMFKLTYRIDERLCVEGTLLARLLGRAPAAVEQETRT